MTIAREQYDYWRSVGWSHGQMIFALGLNAPIRATEADVIAAIQYAGWKMVERPDIAPEPVRFARAA